MSSGTGLLRCVGGTAVAAALLAAGCATTRKYESPPPIVLKHEARVGTNYITLGMVRVGAFEDLREEHAAGTNAVRRPSGTVQAKKIVSKHTPPDTMEFFIDTLEREAAATGLFTIGDGEYTLSGKMHAMKVADVHSVMWCGAGASGGGDPFGLLIAIGLIMAFQLAMDHPVIRASVEYEAVLKKEDREILTTNIQHEASYQSSVFSRNRATRFDEIVNGLLDRAITESLRDLFDGIAGAIPAKTASEDMPAERIGDRQSVRP